MPIIAGEIGDGSEFKSDRVGFPEGTSDPSSPSTGDLYFNTSDKKLRVYDGTSWSNV